MQLIINGFVIYLIYYIHLPNMTPTHRSLNLTIMLLERWHFHGDDFL